ncbi:glycosyltransferase family 2 protein [Halomonas sp. RA08-2]|uniref:glycosyltransferase family 2 protein n=1 Tax=Halomonas sp. RA08-2 TaxID=3440842 RepID=UPI003EE870A1
MKNQDRLISIIIPCWNAEKFISDAIESALNQSFKNVEIIVVNDGSTDNSRAVINRYEEEVISINIANGGPCKARNVAIGAAVGRYIKFLDADDVLTTNALQAEVDLLDNINSYNILPISGTVSVNAKLSNSSVYWTVPFEYLSSNKTIDFEWLLINTPPVGSPLYDRRKLISIGGFDESLTNKEDNDLFIRYLLNDCTPIYTESLSYLYRQYIPDKRTSHDALLKTSASQLHFLNMHIALLDKIDDPKKKKALAYATACRAWSWGRMLARVSEHDEALRHFEIARLIQGPKFAFGSAPYYALSYCFGPIVAERVVLKIKSIKKN